MTRFAMFGAAALLSAMAAAPVTTQEVIYNPGYCAQFYPNANCRNKGPNNPSTGDYQRRNQTHIRLPGVRAPARGARKSLVAATAAGISANQEIRNRLRDHRSDGRPSYSFAIPISLITRPYFAS